MTQQKAQINSNVGLTRLFRAKNSFLRIPFAIISDSLNVLSAVSAKVMLASFLARIGTSLSHKTSLPALCWHANQERHSEWAQPVPLRGNGMCFLCARAFMW